MFVIAKQEPVVFKTCAIASVCSTIVCFIDLRLFFLSRVSTLTRNIDIAILSVCLSVRPYVRPSVRPSVLPSVRP